MIAPASDRPPGSLRDATEAFFRPGGALSRATAGEDFAYEPRPQQRDMARAVAEAIEEGGHLAAEAGTGVGKSFAYLIPLVLAALERKSRVVVSTYTISLQEQLMYKDIPFLHEHLGLHFKAVLVKGRHNYLCRRRLSHALHAGPDLLSPGHHRELERLAAWAAETEEGSLQDLDEAPPSEVWDQVCAEPGICVLDKRGAHADCFFARARRLIREADLLVVNHHLFFSEIALRSQKAGFLPPFDVAVLDEAHEVEDVATEHLGLRLSSYAFEYWLHRLYNPRTRKGLLSYLAQPDLCELVAELGKSVHAFFHAVREWAGFREGETQRLVREPLPVAAAFTARMEELSEELSVLADQVDNPDQSAEVLALQRRGVELKIELNAYLQRALADQVYWVEKEGRRGQLTTLYSAPIEVSDALREQLFGRMKSVIMTSATLAVGSDLGYFVNRIGAEQARQLKVGSPFNYAQQMRVYVARGIPDPNETEAYLPAAVRAIQRFVAQSQGRAFVLFTSAALMRKVADGIRPFLEEEGYLLIMQGEGLPRHRMLEKFKRQSSSVLFGLDSFWTGVDVRGEALSNVIITRLPFAVPDQPVIKARLDRIRERGGEPFAEYSLPEAILKFRQGVGRLIRTHTDEGIIVILDSRVLTKRYGRLFLDAIPECPVEVVDV
jgi:ATP-dependent DNA helicase DinG